MFGISIGGPKIWWGRRGKAMILTCFPFAGCSHVDAGNEEVSWEHGPGTLWGDVGVDSCTLEDEFRCAGGKSYGPMDENIALSHLYG